jgi:hypothetical protein
MQQKTDVWQGTLALMVLKTLAALGPQHGYGIARRIEQTSGDLLSINHGTLYPAYRTTTVRPSSTGSPSSAARNWPLKSASGSAPTTSSRNSPR